MRSRPALKLFLSPPRPSPGEPFRADILIESKSETPFDSIDVELTGFERRFRSITQVNNVAIVNRHEREVLRTGHRFPGGTLAPGAHTRSVNFSLPGAAAPSFESHLTQIWYELSIRVRIPWWPDRHERYTLTVQPPALPPADPSPRLFSTHADRRAGDEPTAELSLASDHLSPGGELSGAVAFFNLGSRRLRRIELTLTTVENPLVVSTHGATNVEQTTYLLSEKTPADGASLPFRLRLPEGLTPAFRTPFIEVNHRLTVTAVVAMGRDIEFSVPLTIARASAEAPQPERLPLIGKARQEAIFKSVLASLRRAGFDLLDEDPEASAVTFRVKDRVVQVTEELREGLGPCLVAQVDGPPLGLGLRVCERRWTDLGKKLDAVDGEFQRRFSVRCREEEQGAALLTGPLREALGRFDEVALDDDDVAALRARVGREQAELLRFFVDARALAEALASAGQALPPPASLAALLPAYEAFADERGVALCVGDLSLRRWRVGAIELSLEHTFDEGQAVRSMLWADTAPQGEAGPWIEAIVSIAERPPVFESNRTGIAFAGPGEAPLCADPGAAVALAERFAEAIASLGRGPSASPYR